MEHNCTELEEKIIRACKKGKEKDQEMLYKHFYGYALSISLRYTHSREEAREVINDSFMKVFAKIQAYNFTYPFKGWLRRIIINTAIDFYRKDSKNHFLYSLESAMDEIQEIDMDIIAKLTLDDILLLLNKLPDVYRIVFNLYEIEGYSHEEIAQMLTISTSTSRVYLTRAKEKLRHLLQVHFKDIYESVPNRLSAGKK